MGLSAADTRRFTKDLTVVADPALSEEGGGGGWWWRRMLRSCPRCQARFPPPPEAGGGGGGQEGSEAEAAGLEAAVARLRLSGWYHEGLTWKESSALLAATPPGTFLVRDSSDRRFLFSLSVQTHKGPTSVRLHCVDGRFRLDAEPALVPAMPLFDCVVRLVEYYVRLTGRSKILRSGGKEQVWVDRSGTVYSDIHLSRPLYRRGAFPSLQHLARLAVNGLPPAAVRAAASFLPHTLSQYLAQYPYTH